MKRVLISLIFSEGADKKLDYSLCIRILPAAYAASSTKTVNNSLSS